jgi:hypothetical protein
MIVTWKGLTITVMELTQVQALSVSRDFFLYLKTAGDDPLVLSQWLCNHITAAAIGSIEGDTPHLTLPVTVTQLEQCPASLAGALTEAALTENAYLVASFNRGLTAAKPSGMPSVPPLSGD